MTKVKLGFIGVGAFVLINVVLTVINILQNGLGGYKGRSVEEILGISPEKATLKDIQRLTKAQVMQLFHAAPAPDFASMNGEYRAELLSLGILAPSAAFYTHHFFGPGHWEGKAFLPIEENRGSGYNLFSKRGILTRTRKFNTYIGPSTIDRKAAFHLDYSPYNSGIVHSMHDELRQVNDRLFICMGHMALGGGAINPAPFVLMGPPTPWIGFSED
ncbi:MAG: hypothetical protein RRA35_03170 [Desulfomonilia bacterium]|nr:hypothetical protein [Desulfomonilia bacterium]